jgi:rSAM/selenodomain-associated transferase 2/rSAM/selenodomain-associated transferase 1
LPERAARLSVIVPALDEAENIAATLQPLQVLRAHGHEVIVVDGGSVDGTPGVAARGADAVLHTRAGRAVQLNAGARAARGDVLLFLHADTLLVPEAALAMLAHLAKGPKAWGRFDVRIAGTSPWLPIIAACMNLRSRLTGIATGDQAIFVRRDAFAAAGGFPDIALMEDIALSRRLKRRAGRPICCRARVVTSGRRWQRHGVLATIVRMWRLRYAYWRGADPAVLAARYPRHTGLTTQPVLQVFAKAPVPGEVKTRLAKSVGEVHAAAVHVALVERTLAVAVAARADGIVRRVELWCDRPDDPRCRRWARGLDALRVQQGDTLGARMDHALRDALARGEPALLIGTDCPVLERVHLADAATALRTCDATFLPAEDGGYVLVGVRRKLDIFSSIAWSTATVMETTRSRLRAAGATWRELPAVWDLDGPEDLARWRALQVQPSGR